VLIQNVPESVRRMNRELLDRSLSLGERKAPEFGSRIDGEDHLLSW